MNLRGEGPGQGHALWQRWERYPVLQRVWDSQAEALTSHTVSKSIKNLTGKTVCSDYGLLLPGNMHPGHSEAMLSLLLIYLPQLLQT